MLFAAPRRELSQRYAVLRVGHSSGRLARRQSQVAAATALGKLLAQRAPPSENPSAMNSSGRSQNYLRVFVAAIVFAAFSWTLVGSVSPQLHARIHADANRSDHVCAITLIASGSFEQAGQPVLVSEPEFKIRFPESTALASSWVKPLFLDAHLFAHAPPVHS